MTRNRARLYAPFIALAVAQAAFLAVGPGRGGSEQSVLAGDPSAQSTGAVSGGPTGSGDVSGAAVGTGGGSSAGGNGAGSAGTAGGATTGAGAGSGSAATGIVVGRGGTTNGGTGPAASTGGGGVAVGAGGVAAGDTSHCKGGRQSDVIYATPPCIPKFAGNNGGATYQGVTDKTIKTVYFECQPNEQVNAILATQGLSASQAEVDAMIQASLDYINKTYELYGRKITFTHVIGDCPLSPPDPARSRQAAAEVAKSKPFAIFHASLGTETHDVWTANQILSMGGSNLDASAYNNRRPFRWDSATSGTEGADQVAEYFCKKLKGKPADHAGIRIHATIGGRETIRKLGVIVPDNGDGSTVPNAKRVQAQVKACGGGDIPIFTYASDIDRAAEQTRAVVAGLIDAKVTTVACMCDAIAPVFLTKGLTQNAYFPEHLLPSAGLLDYDVLGRLYDQSQWTHAFGPGQLIKPVPFDQSDATKIWRASGRTGQPCNACGTVASRILLFGLMVQQAGPNLNPSTIEKALVGTSYTRGGWVETKGNPSVALTAFGPNDYTSVSDFREAWWDPTATSTIDGQTGAYVEVRGGRRYKLGELGPELEVPVKSS